MRRRVAALVMCLVMVSALLPLPVALATDPGVPDHGAVLEDGVLTWNEEEGLQSKIELVKDGEVFRGLNPDWLSAEGGKYTLNIGNALKGYEKFLINMGEDASGLTGTYQVTLVYGKTGSDGTVQETFQVTNAVKFSYTAGKFEKLATPGGLAWDGEYTASWNSVSNTASYRVTFYEDGEEYGRATVEGTSCKLADVAGKTPTEGASYTFKVRALNASGSLEYLSSDDSAPSEAVTYAALYDVYVHGVRVTSENADDVLEDGTVSYDAGTQTLALDGASIAVGDGAYGIYAGQSLTIALVGENSITLSGDVDRAALDASCTAGILCEEGDLSIEAASESGKGALTVSNAAAVQGASASDGYSVYGIAALGGSVSLSGVEVSSSLGPAGEGQDAADGVYASGDIDIVDAQVTARGALYVGVCSAYSSGIFSKAGDISVSGAAASVLAYSGWGGHGIAGVSAEGGSVSISDGAEVIAPAIGDTGGFFTDEYDGIADGIRAHGNITVDAATVRAAGGEAMYSGGIFSETGNIVLNGTVEAGVGRGDAGSVAIGADEGSVTIDGGVVTASVGLSEGGTADGIRAYGDIDINGGAVTASGASLSMDGVEPDYSGGIFSETGDVTISGASTEVEAVGGYASQGVVGIGAQAGDVRVEGATVRANAYNSFTAEAYGVHAQQAGDAGGAIVLDGAVVEAVGSTQGVCCDGALTVVPREGMWASVSVLETAQWGYPELPWEDMAAASEQVAGSPFETETEVEGNLVAGMQYFGSDQVQQTDSDDPNNPNNPGDQDDPAGPGDQTDEGGADGTGATPDAGDFVPAALLSVIAALALLLAVLVRKARHYV